MSRKAAAINVALGFGQETMGEVPEQIRKRFRGLKLPAADVLVLSDELSTARYFESVVAAGAPPKAAANWIMGDVMAFCKVKASLAPLPRSWSILTAIK